MLLVTSCSSTKRAPVPAALKASNYRTSHLASFADLWVRHLREQSELRAAGDLYGGASVAAAMKAAQALNSRLYFVSAGVSLVSSDTPVPSYDLTVAARSASLPPPMRFGPASAADWWGALNASLAQPNPLASLLSQEEGLAILALPRGYLRMVEQDLLTLPEQALRRLRILAVGAVDLPEPLLRQVVSYDARLDQLPGIPRGTKSSAVQRALLDFSRRIAGNPEARSIQEQRARVAAALDGLPFKSQVVRKAMDDDSIAQWILRYDPARTHSASRLLSIFRSEGMACEQSRFARVAHSTVGMQ